MSISISIDIYIYICIYAYIIIHMGYMQRTHRNKKAGRPEDLQCGVWTGCFPPEDAWAVELPTHSMGCGKPLLIPLEYGKIVGTSWENKASEATFLLLGMGKQWNLHDEYSEFWWPSPGLPHSICSIQLSGDFFNELTATSVEWCSRGSYPQISLISG